MAKQSGLGDRLFVSGKDLSGDVTQLSRIGGGVAVIENTGISSSAVERVAGLMTGEISATAWFNDATGQEHPTLRALPTTDVVVSYLRGTSLGNPAACMVAKQINYDGNRGADGSYTHQVQALSTGTKVALEWCEQLTPGKVLRASATNEGSRDYGSVSTLFGASAYWHVFSLDSGTVDGEIQDSADDTSFATVTGLSFTALSAAGAERVATAAGATVRRYVRFRSFDTFSNASLWAGFIRHITATL